MNREPSTTFDSDAAEAAAETRHHADRSTVRHVHTYYRAGRVLVCDCGDVITEGDL